MAMSPGTYLRKRREAAGLSIDDLALATDSEPAVSALSRAEWLTQVERDEVPITNDILDAVEHHPMFAFDRAQLLVLAAIARGEDWPEPQLCRVCACSWWDPCLGKHCEPCAWVDDQMDLCTACVGRGKEATTATLLAGANAIEARP